MGKRSRRVRFVEWAAGKLGLHVTARAAVADELARDGEGGVYNRRLGEQRTRNLPSIDVARMVADAIASFQKDGFAKRTAAILRTYTVGAIPLTCTADTDLPDADREKLQAAINSVWKDRRNKFATRVGGYADALSVAGRICLVSATGPVSLRTRYGFVDAATIDGVVCDPNDAQHFLAVVRTESAYHSTRLLHPVIDDAGEVDEIFRDASGRVLEPGTEFEFPEELRQAVLADAYGFAGWRFRIGQPCVYARVNALPNDAIGISDIYPGLDYLEELDRSLSAFGAKMRNVAALAYHVKLPGTAGDPVEKTIREEIASALEEGAGAAVFTRGPIDIEVLSADLKAADWRQAIRTLLLPYATAVGIPEHLLTGEGGDLNLATAGEIAGPFMAMLQERQTILREFLQTVVLNAVLQFPEIRRLYERDPDLVSFEFSLPTIVAKDAMREVEVLLRQLDAVARLRTAFALKLDAAQKIAQRVAGEYGLQLDADAFDDETPLERLGGFDFLRKPDGDDPDGVAVGKKGQEKAERQAAEV